MNKKVLIWAYLVEVLAAVLIFVVAYLYGGKGFLQFSEEIVNYISMLAGIFFAIMVALWLHWGGVQKSEFGKYLNREKADGVYTTAYSYQTIVFLVVLVTSCLGKLLPSWGKYIICILFLYGLINMWTVIRNTWWLMKLNSKFQAELNRNRD